MAEILEMGDRLRALMPVTVSVKGNYDVQVSVGGVQINGVTMQALSSSGDAAEIADDLQRDNDALPPIFRNPPWRVESVLSQQDLGQTIDWGLANYGVPEAWKTSRGEGVMVAILDTGVQSDHPDLVGQFAETPKNFTSSQGSFDIAGHGTHCAGIVAGSDNGEGIVGVAPKCKLLIGKVLGDDGSGYGEWIAAGLDWAAEQGAHVISMSLGSPYPDPIIHAAIQRATKKGCLVICAAGNSGPRNPTDIDYPGRFDEVVAVASIRKGGELSQFSSRGPHVAFAAPGEQILSTFPTSRYAKLSGTSMATPFVAGVAALLISSRGGRWTRDAFSAEARQHAIDAGDPDRDSLYGWGIIKVDEMLRKPVVVPPVVPPVTPPGAGTVIDLGPLGKVVMHMPAIAGDLISFGKG